MYRELILACVNEPELINELAEKEIDPETYLKPSIELPKFLRVSLTRFSEISKLTQEVEREL